MPNVHFSFRRGAGDVPEILYGKVEIKPTLAFARGTSLVLPAPTTLDLVNGEATASNVYPTPAPVAGQVEWAYRVKAIDTRGQSFEWMVGVPDSTGTVEFASLPRYFETKPPLFGKGEKGDPGEAAKIVVGTVTGGATASVTNTGTNQNAVLDFVLPKGDKGDRGDGVPTGGSALQYIRKDSSGEATEWATLDKTAVGLDNVDNTSDADKPISVAQKTYVDGVDNAPDGNKLATDLPSTYRNGMYVTLGQVANGWPEVSSGQQHTIVTTSKARSNNGGVLQWVTAYNDSEAPVMFRLSKSDNTWGDFRYVVDSKSLRSSLPLLNVEDFGADPTLGSDSQPAIQAAIDLSVLTGQTVYIPAGKYKLQAPLRSPLGNLHLKLDSEAVLERHTNNAMFINGVHKSTVAGGSNILIEGGVWDCRGKDTGSDGSIFALGLGSNITVRNLLAKNVGMSHVAEIAGCIDVYFSINFSGWFGTTQEPEAFQIERMSTAGFPYFNRNTMEISDRITIENCNQFAPEEDYKWWPTAVGGHANQDVLGPNRITVRNCDFATCSKEVLAIDNYTNVVIENVSGQGGASSYILSDNAKTSNVTMRDCTISSTSSAAMLVRRANTVLFDNCIFTGQYGLWISSSTDINVRGGQCFGTQYDAIIINTRSLDTPYVDQTNITIDGVRVEGNHGVAINGNQGLTAKAIKISGIYSVLGLRGQGISVEGNTQSVSLVSSSLKLTPGAYLARITGEYATVIASNNFYSTGASVTNNTSKLTGSNNVAVTL